MNEDATVLYIAVLICISIFFNIVTIRAMFAERVLIDRLSTLVDRLLARVYFLECRRPRQADLSLSRRLAFTEKRLKTFLSAFFQRVSNARNISPNSHDFHPGPAPTLADYVYPRGAILRTFRRTMLDEFFDPIDFPKVCNANTEEADMGNQDGLPGVQGDDVCRDEEP